MSKPVILTGLRANNDLHIGNYFGALLPLIDMAKNHADEYEINLFVPDLHSFTTPIDHSQLYAQILHNLKLFAAAGLPLDHPSIHIYRQSYIPAHSELAWILDCFTGFGEMNRMTQFKDKSAKLVSEGQAVTDIIDQVDGELQYNADEHDQQRSDRISVGLFNYPVLMAADILLYGAEYVPVGDDQTQHLEFARDIAERMNNKFSKLFTIPMPVKEQHTFFGKDQGLRIKDLVDPIKKMSKSDDSGKGIIFLGDSPEDAAKKIKTATTDSLGKIDISHQDQPGVRNLLQILALTTGRSLDTVISEYAGQTQYGPLKNATAEAVSSFLTDFQTRLNQINETQLMTKLISDEYRMNEKASAKLAHVQRAVGLRPKKSSEPQQVSMVLKPQAISFDHFSKIDVRIGTVVSAETVDNSDKLIKLQVDVGTETRQILTGMQAYYRPEDFVGKQVPILINLAPRTIAGEESQGMLLALEGENGPVFLTPEQPLPNGSFLA
jgi:tryptophanyl-tRNA synthetase